VRVRVMVRVKVRIRVWLEFGLCWVSVSGKESFFCSTLVFFCDPIVLPILIEPYYYVYLGWGGGYVVEWGEGDSNNVMEM
jgi:hypothetical protein